MYKLTFRKGIILGSVASLVLAATPAQAIDINPAEVNTGMTVTDGGNGLFSVFGSIRINGIIYAGAPAGALPTYTSAQATLSGLEITGQLHGMSATGGAFAGIDAPIVRWWYRVHNPTGAPIVVAVRSPGAGNLGSGASTQIDASSSGDVILGTNDIWIVTSDGNNGNTDPAFGLVFSSGGGPTQSPLSVNEVNGNVTIEFTNVSVPAGGTISFVYFGCALSFNGAGALGGSTIPQATALVNGLLLPDNRINQVFLTASQFGPLSEIRNLAFAAAVDPTPTPAPTPAPTPDPETVALSIKGKAKIVTRKSSVRLSGKLTGGTGIRVLQIKIGKAKAKRVKVQANGNWRTKVKLRVGKTSVRLTANVGGEKAKPRVVRITRRGR